MSLSNNQYDSIMRDYNRRRIYNKNQADIRYEEVCKNIPEFADFDRKKADLALSYGKQLINGLCDSTDAFKLAAEEIETAKRKALSLCNYPQDYLDIHYDCELCHDTGFIASGVFCKCFKKAAISLLYDQSLKHSLYKKENFQTFKSDWYSDTQLDSKSGKTMRMQAIDAYNTCKRFAKDFDKKFSNLILYGPTGVGKSFLANSIAKALIDSVHSVVHLDAPDFFRALADYHFHSDGDGVDIGLYDCDCLIVDDLGAEMTNSFVISSLCECIEHRRQIGKSMVFTSNLTPADIKEQYQDRTFSRLISNYTFIHMDGDDIRLLIKTNNIRR